MGSRPNLPNRSHKAALIYLSALGLFVAAAVGLSNYQQELGISEPTNSAVDAVYATAQAGRLLEVGDYAEYSTALRVALVAQRTSVINTTVDIEVANRVGRILDYYEAAREAWQAELEGAWDADVHGNPAYWSALHPGLEIGGDAPFDLDDVLSACRRAAADDLAAALALVTR